MMSQTGTFRHFNQGIFIEAFQPFLIRGLPRGSGGKEPSCNAGDRGSVPGWGRSPGEGNDDPLQYSCLENP